MRACATGRKENPKKSWLVTLWLFSEPFIRWTVTGLEYMGRPIYSTTHRADGTGPVQSTRKEEQWRYIGAILAALFRVSLNKLKSNNNESGLRRLAE